MNVFHRFTRKSLAENRTRTVVTIIGIVLSMALFTAVIEGVYSGIRFLQNCEIEQNGPWHGYWMGLAPEEAESLMEQPEIDRAAELSLVGWAEIGSSNPYKPYLLIKSADTGIEELLRVRLIDGRMPEGSNEIMLPEHLGLNGNVYYEIGDTLTVDVGQRAWEQELLGENTGYVPEEEALINEQEHTYTVVGIYERLNYKVEQYSCPGYTAFTADAPGENRTVVFNVKNPKNYFNFTEKLELFGTCTVHSDLLDLYGSVKNGNMAAMIYGLAAILCLLIAFGSVSLIYNSFSISVSERTRQFGILKSLGATKAQIRSCVLYEALLLDAIAVPVGMVIGCVGIGVTLYCLRDFFSAFASGTSVQMRFAAAPSALIAAAVICVLTTLVSALIPAKRAMGVSAIETIRQTADVKLQKKDVRTSPLTAKLFGFEGMMAARNFQRNKKRYRATIISLFLSIVLFISASSFCAYLTGSVGDIAGAGANMDINYELFSMERGLSTEEINALLLTADGVTDSFYADVTDDCIDLDPELVDDSLTDIYGKIVEEVTGGASPVDQFCMIYFVGDDDFRKLCEDNGIRAEGYFNADAPKALLYNHMVVGHAGEGGNTKWYSISFLQKTKVPCTLHSEGIREFEDYEVMDIREENGRINYYFYPVTYLHNYWNDHDDNSELDESRAMILPKEEILQRRDYAVGAVVDELPFALNTGEFSLIYPMSVKQSVAEADRNVFSVFAYRSADHKQTYAQMRKLLADAHLDTSYLDDYTEMRENSHRLVKAINIFSYGFILMISLIAIANVFNTISTSISLRRREFAMLRSIGLAERSFRKMMNYECMMYGLKSLLFGLPVSIAVTYLIFRVTLQAYEMKFYIPWYSILIAAGSVFLVVFATMLYATGKIRKDNPIDALKNENA